MNNVQAMMAGSNAMENSMAAGSRLNKQTGEPKARTAGFKERLDQAHRKMDAPPAGEPQETSTTTALPEDETAVRSGEKPAQSSSDNAKSDEYATALENIMPSESVLPCEDALADAAAAQTILVPVPLEALPDAVPSQGQSSIQPLVQPQTDAAPVAEIIPVVLSSEETVKPASGPTVDSTPARTASPEVEPPLPEADTGNLKMEAQKASIETVPLKQSSAVVNTAAQSVMPAAASSATEKETAAPNKQPQPEQSQSELHKILEVEGRRSSINRLNVQQGQSHLDSQADMSSNDNSQLPVEFNPVDLTVVKAAGREIAAASISNAQAPVDAQDIVNQLVQKAELMIKQNSSEMTIQLKPDGLGRMLIKIMVDDSGAVTAQFTTSNQQVKNMLEQNLHSLRQNLEAQGMRVDRAEVSVQLDNGGMPGDFGGGRQELWQQANSRANKLSNRSYNLEALESLMDSDASIYPNAYENGMSNDGFNFLV